MSARGCPAATPAREESLFLDGCGEIGRLIAAFDWADTPLGPIAGWPACLRIATAMMLRSPVAMTLLWGEQGVMLYNAGYAAIAGQRHPAILGCPVAAAWPEVAAYNLQVLEAGLRGESLSFPDRRFTLIRNGGAEDVWLDVSYSPVPDEAGRPAGVLAVVVETTARTLADERLRVAQEAGRVGTFEWYPQTKGLVVSDVYRQIYGFTPHEAVTDFRLLEMVVPEDRHLTGNVRFGRTANPLSYAEYRIRHGVSGEIRWMARRGEILQGGKEARQRYIGVSWDITERKTAELQDAFIASLGDRLRDLAGAREVVAVASEMLGRHLGAGRVGYGEISADGTQAVVERDWTRAGLPSLAGRHDIEAFGTPVVEALRRGETVRTDDALADARLRAAGVADAYAAISTRAAITVPLIRDGRLAGVLFAHDPAPRAWTPSEEAILHIVAARIWDSARRAQAEQKLRESEENFRQLAQAIPIQVWVCDPDGRVTWVNDQAYRYTGCPPGDLQREDWSRLVHPDDEAASVLAWEGALRSGIPCEFEHRIRRHDGTFRWHLVRNMPIRDGDGRVIRWIGTNTDIEEQRRALADLVALNATLEERVEERTAALRQTEEALRQAQKMEALGQLTGGIAHDFNNLLTGIIGSLELVRRRLGRFFPEGGARLAELDRFMEAATSSALNAAALTQRLLAFARRQPLDTRPVDVAALLGGMEDLLRRTLGGQVELRIAAAEGCWPALTDPSQLESAILNLAINARDAMPQGGRLTIGAANLTLDQAAARAAGPLEPGDYVAIAVADTGIGMPEEVIGKAFDPFFTTKPTGRGTGLGLSMVYGFTRQSGGDARIASRPGMGTVVTLRLPRAASPAAPEIAPPSAAASGAGETVLVVEDVPEVRMLIVEVLRDLGYCAIEAADGSEALPIIASATQIDLLVTDIGLPGLNGRQIAEQARARRPGLKVLFVTGYAGDTGICSDQLEEGMVVIGKPFAAGQFAARIGELMRGVEDGP